MDNEEISLSAFDSEILSESEALSAGNDGLDISSESAEAHEDSDAEQFDSEILSESESVSESDAENLTDESENSVEVTLPETKSPESHHAPSNQSEAEYFALSEFANSLLNL